MSVISIPVSPLILSLFNECKDNLKYADKSNTDFLIFLLNSSMHIFSIVKEFSPILHDALNSAASTDSQLQELKDKSSEFLSPEKSLSNISNKQQEDDEGCLSDDEVSINSPSSSLHSSLIADSTISDHFASYKQSPKRNVSKEGAFSCPTCSASFAFRQGLNRHRAKNSCEYHLGRKRKRSLLDSFNESQSMESNQENGHSVGENDEHNGDSDEEDDDLSDIENASENETEEENQGNNSNKSFGGNLLCPDCGKSFSAESNLNRHLKLSKVCGVKFLDSADDLLSVSLPSKVSSEDSGFECSFCGSILSTEKTFNVHKRRFRCRRRCKICDFTAAHSLGVQSHLEKEHNLSLSIEDIEKYNKSLFLEHYKDMNFSDENRSSVMQCPVYKCEFSTNHKGGLTTHMRFCKAAVENKKDRGNCDKCGTFGIPLNEMKSHECKVNSNGNDSISETSQKNSINGNDGIEKTNSPSRKTPVLKLKRKSSSSPKTKYKIPALLKLATNSTSPKKKKLSLGSTNKSDPRYQCKFCDFVATSQQSFAGHMNVHTFKRPKAKT